MKCSFHFILKKVTIQFSKQVYSFKIKYKGRILCIDKTLFHYRNMYLIDDIFINYPVQVKKYVSKYLNLEGYVVFKYFTEN